MKEPRRRQLSTPSGCIAFLDDLSKGASVDDALSRAMDVEKTIIEYPKEQAARQLMEETRGMVDALGRGGGDGAAIKAQKSGGYGVRRQEEKADWVDVLGGLFWEEEDAERYIKSLLQYVSPETSKKLLEGLRHYRRLLQERIALVTERLERPSRGPQLTWREQRQFSELFSIVFPLMKSVMNSQSKSLPMLSSNFTLEVYLSTTEGVEFMRLLLNMGRRGLGFIDKRIALVTSCQKPGTRHGGNGRRM